MALLNYEFSISEYDTETYEYEADDRQCTKLLISTLKADYPGLTEDDLERRIEDDFDTLVSEYEDVLKDYFEDDAKEMFNDSKAYEKDIYAYHGVSRKDFE